MEEASAPELDYVTIDSALVQQAIDALAQAQCADLKIITAESCTGGLVALLLSEAPGAAEYLDGGFVVYDDNQKRTALGVEDTLLREHGAVSAEVARAMALGALKHSDADIAISITGVTGPDTDERGNPIGLVFLACALRYGSCEVIERQFGNIGRSRVRREAAIEGLRWISTAARRAQLP